MFEKMGTNYAANLPAWDTKEYRRILGARISEYVISVCRKKLNLQLILNIDSDVDLCRETTYLCEDNNDIDMSDSAVDGPLKERDIPMPRFKTFHGYCKGGYRYKLAAEQLECIYQCDILKNWFNTQLAKAIENGRQSIMARFYRHMIMNVHEKNTGNNAGMIYGGNKVGSVSSPVMYDKHNADKFFMAVSSTIKQMPDCPSPENKYMSGLPGDTFIFGPSIMENVLMQVDEYQRWDSVGDCASCSLFKDVFDRKPRGIMPLTGDCVEAYDCVSAGETQTVYPVLFGRRFIGAKASMRVKTHNWESDDGESYFFQTTFYHHMHVYDPCYFGLGYIVINQEQPETITCG